MKLAKIYCEGRTAAAAVSGDEVHVVGDWYAGDPALASFDPQTARSAEVRETRRLDEIAFLPPIGPSAKIICLGLNYRAHVDELGGDAPPQPSLFTKVSDALSGCDEAIVRPLVSTHFDFEGEIAVVIGAAGRHIKRADALGHVLGYTIMLDGSIRDYQQHSVSAGKNFWRSGALGPWITTADEIPDPALLHLTTRLNGTVVQSASAGLMIYDVATVIAYVSGFTPLAPGDVIAMGTPAGVGAGRQPPLWMKAGDRIEVEVSGVGVLSNFVEDES